MIRASFFYFSLLLMFGFSACQPGNKSAKSTLVKNYYCSTIDTLQTAVDDLLLAIEQKESEKRIQQLFKSARLAYKKTEFFAEYYSPVTCKFINGAPIPDMDVDDQHRIIQPEGFQVIEAFIFPKLNLTQIAELKQQTKILKSNCYRLKDLTTSIYPTNQHVFDALRLELFRIITMGISGFDAPASQNSMEEAAFALASVQKVLSFYQDSLENTHPKAFQQCQQLNQQAQLYLKRHRGFNSFNRMHFIINYANPLSQSIYQLGNNAGIKAFDELRPLKTTAPHLFAKNIFNPDYYTYNAEQWSTPDKVQLGKMLFYDPILSGNGKRSCASCHNPAMAFTDGEIKSKSISGQSTVFRNTPTILNAGLQSELFYDLRVSYLEDQAAAVISNKEEMHGSLALAVQLLKRQESYQKLFQKAYPKTLEPLNEMSIKNALASYVRSLESLNSPFDQYVRGDHSQLNQQEINGFNLYMGKAKCGTCHFAPLFNGNVPPNFTRTEAEIIGVPIAPGKKQIDPDPGKYNLRQIAMHRFAFKTPTLRNIAQTAPYMHNGAFKTLEEVIDFYNEGGGAGLGIDLPNQTLPFDKLNLSEQEKKDIIAFLKKLSG